MDSADVAYGEYQLNNGPCPYNSSDHNGASSAVNADELSDMAFCMAAYSKEIMKMMFMMRSHHMLTDVVLEVEHELFHAHKVVLSAASPYFKAMFTGGLKESEMSRVKLQGVCPTAMAKIMYFMYTGHIRVTEVTVCQLLPAATMFQVPNVVEACCAFLERQLDPTNAIGIANFAEQHGCIQLKQKANQFIERHFTQICLEEEFLQLSAMQLVSLIRKDELNVQEEREVYNAVLKWVKYDEDNRYPKMEHILYAVRCQFLTPNFLKDQMKNCDVLRKVPACREYLARIFKDLTLHKRPVVKERTPNTTRMIFIAGGYFKNSLDMLEGFNVDDKTWITLPKLRVPRSGLGAAFLKGTFYAVGGRNNSPESSYDSDWVDRYNPITETWRPCSPMSCPRNRVGVAVMDELLYAVGGSAGSEYHNTVEYFDPEVDRWTIIQPMHSKRLGVGVTVVNRLLYAIGGFNGKERLATVECYHPENNVWNILPSMKSGRSGAGVVALNQHIYVVGGFDGTRQLASVERYDTELQVWDTVASIRIARSALSVTTLDNKLYAMGGYDGQSFLNIVEVYDPETNVWEEGVPLTSGRSGHASAVIYQPSRVDAFMDCLEQISDSGNDKNGGQRPFDNNSDKSTSQSPPPSSLSQSSTSSGATHNIDRSSLSSSGPSSSRSNNANVPHQSANLVNNMYYNDCNENRLIRSMTDNLPSNINNSDFSHSVSVNNNNRSVNLCKKDKNNLNVVGDYVDSIINNESLNDIKLNSIISNLISVTDNSVHNNNNNNNINPVAHTNSRTSNCILTRKILSCSAKRLRKKTIKNAEENAKANACKMKRKASDNDALCLRQDDDGGEKVKSPSANRHQLECPFSRLKRHLNDFVSSIVSPASNHHANSNNSRSIDNSPNQSSSLPSPAYVNNDNEIVMLNSNSSNANDLLTVKKESRKTKCKLKACMKR